MSRLKAISIATACLSLLAACNEHHSPTESRASTSILWTITSMFVSAEGTDVCVQAPSPEGAVSYPQLIIVNGSTIAIENTVGCDNGECSVFGGSVSGSAFTATADASFDWSGCGLIQGTATISGTFSDDWQRLTGSYVLSYTETSGHQVVIRYSWNGVRHP